LLAPVAIVLPPAVSYFLAPHGGWPLLSPDNLYIQTGLTVEKLRLMKRMLKEADDRAMFYAANPPMLMDRYIRFLGFDMPAQPGQVWSDLHVPVT